MSDNLNAFQIIFNQFKLWKCILVWISTSLIENILETFFENVGSCINIFIYYLSTIKLIFFRDVSSKLYGILLFLFLFIFVWDLMAGKVDIYNCGSYYYLHLFHIKCVSTNKDVARNLIWWAINYQNMWCYF